MKTLYFVVEAYPREFALKAVPVLEKLRNSLPGISIELIIFSETKLNSEKIAYLGDSVKSITGKEVRDLNASDHFETVKRLVDAENCFGIAAFASPFADEYIPRLAAVLNKSFIGACYGINPGAEGPVLTKERYDGQMVEDNIVGMEGACFTFVSIREGRPDAGRRMTEDEMIKFEPVKAESFFEHSDTFYQPHKNRKDIREFKSFIALSDEISRSDISERDAETIAKNILGVKTGDCSALENGLIDEEREISLYARPVSSSFMMNFGMSGLPCEVNAVCSRGPVVYISRNMKSLYSKMSDIIINRDPEEFLVKFSSEIEKYSRY